MPSCLQFSGFDTVELKSQIFRKLGRQKAEKYFSNLKRLLSLKISKREFDKLCYGTLGKENIALHNLLIKAILSRACLSHGPPSKRTATGHSQNTNVSNGFFGDMFPMSPRKGRSVNSRDRRFCDRLSPLGLHGKMINACDMQRSREEQSAPELISIGSKALLEVISVEDGEEVEQMRDSPGVQSRSPVRPPLGLSFGSHTHLNKGLPQGSRAFFGLSKSNIPETCRRSDELPDTRSLKKRLEGKVEHEGLGLSMECVHLLNTGLDTYLKRLIKPCMDLARSRGGNDSTSRANGNFSSNMHEEHVKGSNQQYSASLLDFQVAMESNRQLLGGDWPIQLEKICSFIR